MFSNLKNYLLLLIVFSFSIAKAEIKAKVYYEQIENGYKIYADNNEFCPVSVKIDFTVLNLQIEGGNNKIYVIEALKNKQLLTTIKVIVIGKSYKISFTSFTNFGNNNVDKFDEDFAYDLPFKKSDQFLLFQGYNGKFSHKNENSLDFSMPIGTEIVAIRDGIVINVVDQNTKNCAEESCKQYNNLILVFHSDGTFAEYDHIKQNGSRVKIGEKILKGQVIALSGNTGWSTGPHLHLVIFKQKLFKRETLKTKFKIDSGDKIDFLNEKTEYSKNY